MSLLVLAILTPLAHAETVRLRFDPAAASEHPMRCTADREQRTGPRTSTVHTDMRVVPVVTPVGKRWAIGTRELTVLAEAHDPAPPPGVPTFGTFAARLEPVMPRMLVDARGRWKGVEAADPAALLAVFDPMLSEMALPEAQGLRMRAMLAERVAPAPLEAGLWESWYARLGHWIDREVPVGTAALGVAPKRGPLTAGSTLTWSASAPTACADDGPDGGAAAGCVDLRLEARMPDGAVRDEAIETMTTLANAAGVDLGGITFRGGSSVTTWTARVEPDTLRTWRTERRRVTDTELAIGDRTLVLGTVDVQRCVTE